LILLLLGLFGLLALQRGELRLQHFDLGLNKFLLLFLLIRAAGTVRQLF
jgi:hypothetical protein